MCNKYFFSIIKGSKECARAEWSTLTEHEMKVFRELQENGTSNSPDIKLLKCFAPSSRQIVASSLIIDVMMVEGELDIASSLIIQCSSHFKYW
jgi:hypothetical protein